MKMAAKKIIIIKKIDLYINDEINENYPIIIYTMKMQIIIVFKEYFSILCTKLWHHGEDSASAW